MDTMRFVLLLAIGLVGMMLVQKWQQDYGQPVAVTESEPTAVAATDDEGIPDIPLLEQSVDPLNNGQLEGVASAKTETVSVRTDVYELQISLQGAGIEQALLRQFPQQHEQPDEPFVLFDNSASLFYVMQGGLRSTAELPTHKSVYSSSQSAYALEDGQDQLEVVFSWASDDYSVDKIYRFQRDSYVIDIEYRINNQSAESIKLAAYNQLQRNDPGREGRRLLYTYTGAVLSTPEKRYEKLSFGDLEDKDLNQSVSGGWVAMIQHYFVSALLPAESGATEQYYSIALPEKNRYFIGSMTPAMTVAAGDSAQLQQKAYVGPKTHKRLQGVAPSLELVVDYGSLWFIAKPLFTALAWFHQLTGNWGWAIILVTIIIKLVFYPLSAAGYRSMANMRRVQPRLLSIRERYKNDKQRLNQAMMELYKEEKINPLGGCFPILVQIPVFIALYWVLLETVEMRQAPFMLWLQDLSSPDPFFVLPLLMGVTMFIQQKLNPAPMDPMQQKVMTFLPIVFTVFFAFFPSGLVLYWVSNNILSILQQARINHTLEKVGLK